MIAVLRPHLIPFLALLGLLGVTAFAAFLPLGNFNLPVSLIVAIAQSLLVIFFFMGLRTSSTLLRLSACAGFLWLAILLLLALSDFFTRFPG